MYTQGMLRDDALKGKDDPIQNPETVNKKKNH